MVRVRRWDIFILGSWDVKSTGDQASFKHSWIQGFTVSLYPLILCDGFIPRQALSSYSRVDV